MLGFPLHISISGISTVLESWGNLSRPSLQLQFTSRQNGQLIATSMAVVVQEMVDADCAGVLFTRDPVTGDPSRIVITANYGLGEVSSTIFFKHELNGSAFFSISFAECRFCKV